MSAFMWIALPVTALLLVAFVVIVRHREDLGRFCSHIGMLSPAWISIPLAALLVIVLVVIVRRRDDEDGDTAAATQQCPTAKCGALDPVSDPAYNMTQVVKQSILLEEHLTQGRKRCKDCQLKHLLHIQGLVEEAAMLAGERAKKFPLLDESLVFYDKMLKKWLDGGRDDVGVQLSMSTQLRDWRKKLANEYFLEGM